MAEATRDARSRQSRRARSALPARPSGRIGGEARAVSTRAAASARRTPPARGVWEGQLEQRTHSSRPFVCSPKRQYRTCVSHIRTFVLPVKRVGYSTKVEDRF